MSFLDILFPKRCVQCKKFGSYICPDCFSFIVFIENTNCTVCQRPAIGGITHPKCQTKYELDGVFSSLIYTGVVKKLVYVFKYKPHLTAIRNTLIDLFYEGIIQKEFFMQNISEHTVFIPVPLHKSKLRKRGYNQAMLLAKGAGKKFEVPVVDLLERVKNTKTQVGLSQIERRSNIRDAFVIKKEFIYSSLSEQSESKGGRDICLRQAQTKTLFNQAFLVDDVVTSGATLREAARVLKKAGVEKVWGITLAHGL